MPAQPQCAAQEQTAVLASPPVRVQDSTADEEAAGAAGAVASTSSAARAPHPRRQPLEEEWRRGVLPVLVGVLQQRRGQHLQESKEAAAGVLAKYAANGGPYAAAVW